MKFLSLLIFFSTNLFASNFVKVSGADMPSITPEGDFEVFKTGLKYEVEFCKKAKSKSSATIDFAGRLVTRKDWCLKTGARLLEVAAKSTNFEAFYGVVKSEFDLYKSKGDDGLGTVHYTGYYSPTLELSARETVTHPYPVYKKPTDLVLSNGRWMRKIAKGKLVPYYTRKQIDEEGVLKGKGLEIGFAKDLFDVFVFHVQGAGAAVLIDQDNKRSFLNYAAQNGHPYKSIRGILKARGVEEKYLTIPGIRQWFSENPTEVKSVLYQSPGYVFFKEDTKGPLGATPTVLSNGHSVAVDPKFNPLSGMALVRSERPVLDSNNQVTGWQSFSRFAIANDTGGAIKGPARVDYFWGDDSYAETAAGFMNQTGELYFLLLKN